jgi:hypothetical protein
MLLTFGYSPCDTTERELKMSTNVDFPFDSISLEFDFSFLCVVSLAIPTLDPLELYSMTVDVRGTYNLNPHPSFLTEID